MASMNRVFLLGNLTRDPEVRYLPSGQAVAEFRLAVSHKYKTQSGEEKEDTCYVDVSVWGRQAETCGQYLSKGSPALVDGRLKYDEWEKDGKKNNKLRVVAERVQFVGAPRRNAEVSDGPGDEAPAAKPPRPPPPAADRDGAGSAPQSGDDDNLPF
jgi:single-strand DNA-binding protein